MTQEMKELLIELGENNIKVLNIKKPAGYKALIARWEVDIKEAKGE